MANLIVTNHFLHRAETRCGIKNPVAFVKRVLKSGICMYGVINLRFKSQLFSRYIYDRKTETILVIQAEKIPYVLVTIYKAEESSWFKLWKKRNPLKDQPKAREEYYEPIFPEGEGYVSSSLIG